jgi:hypothetical protein
MSEPTRMTTRPRNADAHPGLLALGAKRRRAADGVTKKAAAEAKKVAMEERRQHAVLEIASIERQIAEVDAIDITPQPGNKAPQRPHPLRRTETFINIPPADEGSEDESNIPGATELNPLEENPSESGDLSGGDAPPKKKAKSSKPGIRDAVERCLKERDGSELWQVRASCIKHNPLLMRRSYVGQLISNLAGLTTKRKTNW